MSLPQLLASIMQLVVMHMLHASPTIGDLYGIAQAEAVQSVLHVAAVHTQSWYNL